MIGQCFPWAQNYATKNDGCIVCHGIVTEPCSSPPKQYVHAWIEHNGLCLDWQTMVAGCGGNFRGQGYPKDIFYELFKPHTIHTYCQERVLVLSLQTGHSGPWDSDFDRF